MQFLSQMWCKFNSQLNSLLWTGTWCILQEQNPRGHVIQCTMICQHYHSSERVLLEWINTWCTKYERWTWLEVVWPRKPVLLFWLHVGCVVWWLVMWKSPHMQKWGYKVFQHVVRWICIWKIRWYCCEQMCFIIIFSFGNSVDALMDMCLYSVDALSKMDMCLYYSWSWWRITYSSTVEFCWMFVY